MDILQTVPPPPSIAKRECSHCSSQQVKSSVFEQKYLLPRKRRRIDCVTTIRCVQASSALNTHVPDLL